MEENPRVRPFQKPDGQPKDRSDETSARDRWAETSDDETALRRSQARRLIGRRPLLRGLGAGAGLLIATGGDLRAALLVPSVALGQTTDFPTTTFTTSTPPPFTTSTTTESTSSTTTRSNDDDKRKKSNTEKDYTNKSGDDDHRIEGKIKAINLDGPTPTITIFGKDGDIVLELRGDAKNFNGKVGDYISAHGEKQHEGLYEIEFIRKE